MNYEESMAGLDQIFEALFRQQQQPQSVEVDEMQQGKQGQMDQMAQIMQMGGDLFPTGERAVRAMQEADDKDSMGFSWSGM